MSLFEELIEVTSKDEKIVKSFKTKGSLSGVIFDKLRIIIIFYIFVRFWIISPKTHITSHFVSYPFI